MDNASETTPPSPQEIQEVAQRILVSLTEEKRSQLRNSVMRTMSEEQRRQATATNKDPLIQYIVQKAREESMNRNVSGQVDTQQRLQHQHQRLTSNQLQELNASQRGLQHTDVPPAMLAGLATQHSHDDVDTTAATVATSLRKVNL